MAAPDRIILTTLGRTLLQCGERIIPLPWRGGALLAFISERASHTISRREAVELLWPDVDEKRGRHSLSQLLYELRSITSCPIPRVTGEHLEGAGVVWDVAQLRLAYERHEYDSVLALYGGTFMPELARFGPLMDWRDEIDAGVAWRTAEALREESFRSDAKTISHIIATAEHLLIRHPHLASAQIALIHSAVRQGNTKLAGELHARFSTADDHDELPPLQQFLEQATLPEVRRSTAFVGRESELEQLLKSWRVSKEGSAQVVIVTGESGIGKTQLADQFLRRVAIAGTRTWVGDCCAATQRLAYSAIRNLMEDNINSVAPAYRSRVVDAFLALEQHGSESPDETRHRLTETLTAAAEATAALGSLVIFLDDAQWADQYTALLLSYWAHRLKDRPVLILLATRTQESESSPEWIAADLARAQRVDLRHLSIESAKEMVRSFEQAHAISFDIATRDSLLWLSAGRPFLLLEALAATLQDSLTGPTSRALLTPTAEAVLRRRFNGLAHNAACTAEFLAVWGKPLDVNHIAAALEFTASSVADAIDKLQLRGISRLSRGKIAFEHDLMRETAYRMVLPGTRALLHTKAAALALAEGEPYGFVAHQFAEAGEGEKTAQYAFAAADDALSVHSYADYEHYLRLAFDRGDTRSRQRAAVLLATLQLRSGQTTKVSEFIEALHDSDPQKSAIQAVVSVDDMTRGAAAVEVVARVAELLRTIPDHDGSLVLPILGTVLDVSLDADVPQLGSKFIDALANAKDFALAEDIELQISAHRAIWSASESTLEGALAEALRLRGRLRKEHALATKALCHYTVGTLYLLKGEVKLALPEFDEAFVAADQCSDTRRVHAVHINRGVALMEAGDLSAATESLQKALSSPSLHVRIRAYTNLAIVHLEAGRADLASDAAHTVLSMNTTYRAAELSRTSAAILVLLAMEHGRGEGSRHGSLLDDLSGVTPFEDTSYSTIARAMIARQRGKTAFARQILLDEIQRVRERNHLASMRIECALAEFLIPSDTEAAAQIAARLAREAEFLGARQLYKRAKAIIRATT